MESGYFLLSRAANERANVIPSVNVNFLFTRNTSRNSFDHSFGRLVVPSIHRTLANLNLFIYEFIRSIPVSLTHKEIPPNSGRLDARQLEIECRIHIIKKIVCDKLQHLTMCI